MEDMRCVTQLSGLLYEMMNHVTDQFDVSLILTKLNQKKNYEAVQL